MKTLLSLVILSFTIILNGCGDSIPKCDDKSVLEEIKNIANEKLNNKDYELNINFYDTTDLDETDSYKVCITGIKGEIKNSSKTLKKIDNVITYEVSNLNNKLKVNIRDKNILE